MLFVCAFEQQEITNVLHKQVAKSFTCGTFSMEWAQAGSNRSRVDVHPWNCVGRSGTKYSSGEKIHPVLRLLKISVVLLSSRSPLPHLIHCLVVVASSSLGLKAINERPLHVRVGWLQTCAAHLVPVTLDWQ